MTESPLEPLAVELRQWTALAAEIFEGLKQAGLPDQLAADLTFAWLTGAVDD
jgi:hypothetical protein